MAVFLTIMCVGFAVLLVSFILGEFAEHGMEAAHDVAHGIGVGEHEAGDGVEHAHGGPSFLSIRFIAAFATGFGGGGAIGVHVGLSYGWSSLLGIGSAFIVAGITYAVVSFLYKQQSSSSIGASDFVGKTATVYTAIGKDSVGEVTFILKGATVTQLARSEDGRAMLTGTTVTIKKVVGNTVIVG